MKDQCDLHLRLSGPANGEPGIPWIRYLSREVAVRRTLHPLGDDDGKAVRSPGRKLVRHNQGVDQDPEMRFKKARPQPYRSQYS